MGTGTPPGGGGIPDGWDNDCSDIDRWENDGGRSPDRGNDWKSYGGLGYYYF
ncbi:hypothetical protein JFL43_20050 [Viridibacillus sp. YIM B01967]|uniref:Uncharacterized protein n=1 Tax=Viridibacillus soli TaxID=2798301 RepID=A0ABS1HCD7_9BACL|nr:hypothetical protein [Viridibacillus soli]MBK3497083.1 hypothetical protein [Viridibacillus soli]